MISSKIIRMSVDSGQFGIYDLTELEQYYGSKIFSKLRIFSWMKKKK